MTDTPTAAPTRDPGVVPPAAVRRPGRRGRRPLAGGDGAPQLEAQTIKAYPLSDDARRTVGYLRRIVNQRHVPDEARVTVEGDRITIEWADG